MKRTSSAAAGAGAGAAATDTIALARRRRAFRFILGTYGSKGILLLRCVLVTGFGLGRGTMASR